jgi:hypothetical protein
MATGAVYPAALGVLFWSRVDMVGQDACHPEIFRYIHQLCKPVEGEMTRVAHRLRWDPFPGGPPLAVGSLPGWPTACGGIPSPGAPPCGWAPGINRHFAFEACLLNTHLLYYVKSKRG